MADDFAVYETCQIRPPPPERTLQNITIMFLLTFACTVFILVALLVTLAMLPSWFMIPNV